MSENIDLPIFCSIPSVLGSEYSLLDDNKVSAEGALSMIVKRHAEEGGHIIDVGTIFDTNHGRHEWREHL